MSLPKSSSTLVGVSIAALGAAALSWLLPHTDSILSSNLLSSVLLCVVTVAIILSSKGIRYSVASPLALFPGIYLISLGLPSLENACGFYRHELFFKSNYVSVVNYFVLGFLGFFYMGYLLADSRIAKNEAARLLRVFQFSTSLPGAGVGPVRRRMGAISGVHHNLLCVLALGAFACAFPLLGLERIWEGHIARGSGQWDPWNFNTYLLQLVQACLVMSTLTAGVVRAWQPWRRLWLAPLSWATFLAASGSRATLLPFTLFLLASEAAGRKLTWRKVVLVGLITFFSMTYITEFRPSALGLVNFFETMSEGTSRVKPLEPLGGVSSLGPTTAVFWISRTTSHHNIVAQVWRLLTPLPSFIVHQDVALTNVLPYVGIYGGNLGVPFSVIGELFFFFGWGGVLFGLVAGFSLAWLFQKCQWARTGQYGSILWPLLYIACVFGAIMSVHSGMRTATRLPIWAIVWYFCFSQLANLLRLISLGMMGPTVKGGERKARRPYSTHTSICPGKLSLE